MIVLFMKVFIQVGILPCQHLFFDKYPMQYRDILEGRTILSEAKVEDLPFGQDALRVYINPTRSELITLLERTPDMRGIADDTNVFFFDALAATHVKGEKALKAAALVDPQYPFETLFLCSKRVNLSASYGKPREFSGDIVMRCDNRWDACMAVRNFARLMPKDEPVAITESIDLREAVVQKIDVDHEGGEYRFDVALDHGAQMHVFVSMDAETGVMDIHDLWTKAGDHPKAFATSTRYHFEYYKTGIKLGAGDTRQLLRFIIDKVNEYATVKSIKGSRMTGARAFAQNRDTSVKVF
jgi:hypothetical protein